MNPMKRLGLAALVVVLGVLFTASRALAKPPQGGGGNSFTLTPPETDPPEPLASGKYTLKPLVHRIAVYWEVYVTCWNLTPGEQYSVCVYDYTDGGTNIVEATANSKGKLTPEPIISWSNYVDVWVVNDKGAVVLANWY